MPGAGLPDRKISPTETVEGRYLLRQATLAFRN
jgi:hypothetical protein